MSSQINYRTEWLESEANQREHILSVLRQVISEFRIEHKNVVELGCGIGTNLSLFAKTNNTLGIEGMASAAAEAERRGIRTIVGNLEESLDVSNDYADIVLCIDVLEHLVSPEHCLREAFRILRGGGLLIVNVPNHFDWRGRLRILFGSGIDSQRYFPESAVWEYPHLRFFNHRSIEDLVIKCGFSLSKDFSSNFNSAPKYNFFKGGFLEIAYRGLLDAWPDLFEAGYFLVCEKIDEQ